MDQPKDRRPREANAEPATTHGLTDWVDADNATVEGQPEPVLYFDGHRGETMNAGQLGDYVAHLARRCAILRALHA